MSYPVLLQIAAFVVAVVIGVLAAFLKRPSWLPQWLIVTAMVVLLVAGSAIIVAVNDADGPSPNGAPYVTRTPEPDLVPSRSMNTSHPRLVTLTPAHEGIETAESAVATSVAFNHDGSRIATGGIDRMVRLWDASSGAALGPPLSGHRGAVNALAFIPGTTLLASASEDRTIWLWDANTGAVSGQPVITGHSNTITAMSVSPDGTRIATASIDGTVRIFNTADWNLVRLITLTGEWPYAVAFSADSRTLVTGSGHWEPAPAYHVARSWDVASGTKIAQFEGHTATIIGAAFVAGSEVIATAGHDQAVRFWQSRTASIVSELTDFPAGVSVLCLAVDTAGVLLAAGVGSDIAIRRIDSGAYVENYFGFVSLVERLAISPTGARVAAVARDGSLGVWTLGDQ
jgi:WD40 repeat protein